jgi:hypothetical protein
LKLETKKPGFSVSRNSELSDDKAIVEIHCGQWIRTVAGADADNTFHF